MKYISLINTHMITKIQTYLPRYLPVGTGALLCLLTLYAFLQWHQDWTLAHQPKSSLITPLDAHAPDFAASLAEAHLFGIPAKETSTLPITSLPIQLTGVIKGTKQEQSKAIISTEGQPGKLYQIGDTLPSGAVIHDITTQEIIFDNGGHLEKLSLPRHKTAASGASVNEPTE